jgi:hypothetical protein
VFEAVAVKMVGTRPHQAAGFDRCDSVAKAGRLASFFSLLFRLGIWAVDCSLLVLLLLLSAWLLVLLPLPLLQIGRLA